MSQRENLECILQLHSIMTGRPQTLEQILNRRTIDPDVILTHDTELSGKVTSGFTVSVADYYTLGEDQIDRFAAAEAR
jgi:hypothetical protein